jgi:glycosyltransferase involved in cell wall biosynthesis
VIIPVRNERDFLAGCLDSVLANGYPQDRLEILVVDGRSDDGGRAVLDSYASRYGAIRILDNPKRTTPAALNAGIGAARGEIVMRLDAHARLSPGYVAQCVAWMEASGADNVGGAMRTVARGSGLLAEAIAAALSHRFGVGNSAFRTAAGEPRWVDTVFGGCYRRAVFERVGLFNERLPRGQDLEFNLRLKRAGGRTLLVPSTRCDYFARSGLRSFLAHNFTNGVWAVRPFFESEIVPVRPRHLAPLGFVLALLAAAAAAWWPTAGLTPLIGLSLGYGGAALGASLEVSWRRRGGRFVLALPAVFAGLHLAYGLGSLWGLLGATGERLARVVHWRRTCLAAAGRRAWGYEKRPPP